MGMYNYVMMRVQFKHNAPHSMLAVVRGMCENDDFVTDKTEVGMSATGAWAELLHKGPVADLFHNWAGHKARWEWCDLGPMHEFDEANNWLRVNCSHKNDKLFQEFADWIKPYVEECSTIFGWYEEFAYSNNAPNVYLGTVEDAKKHGPVFNTD